MSAITNLCYSLFSYCCLFSNLTWVGNIWFPLQETTVISGINKKTLGGGGGGCNQVDVVDSVIGCVSRTIALLSSPKLTSCLALDRFPTEAI